MTHETNLHPLDSIARAVRIIEEFRDKVFERIGADAANQELPSVRMFTKLVERVEQALEQQEEILEVMCEAESMLGNPDEYLPTHGNRSITVEVTEGMIKQSLLTLTVAKQEGYVSIGEKLEISLTNGKTFETVLVQPGNRLKERGKIREFYSLEGVVEGDKAHLSETSKGKWQLYSSRSEIAKEADKKAAELFASRLPVLKALLEKAKSGVPS